MDYSLLGANELEEMFYRTKNPFHLDAWGVSRMSDEHQKRFVERIRTGLEQLTPNIVEWAFASDDWRPAQSMATFIACGKLSQYEHLLNKQLQTCYFCGPYIYALVRISSSDTNAYLETYLTHKMTVQVAQAETTRSSNLHIDIAYVALEWLDEKYDTQIDPSYLESWQQFNAAFLKKHKYEFRTLANTRRDFTHYMDFFEQNFD